MGRILIVDDEPNIRVTLEQCLTAAGHAVSVAADGWSAIREVEADALDLILLDIKLPDIDGLEVLQRIKERRSEQAVVMITAYGTVETAVEAMKIGAVDYLQKPFTPDEIRDVVATVLGRDKITPTEAERCFEASLQLGKLCISNRRPAEAVPHFRRAIGLDPQNPQPYNLLGMVFELQGEVLEAVKMYRAALAVDPTYQPAADNLERATEWDYKPLEQQPKEEA